MTLDGAVAMLEPTIQPRGIIDVDAIASQICVHILAAHYGVAIEDVALKIADLRLARWGRDQ
jgi:hypothetical protein